MEKTNVTNAQPKPLDVKAMDYQLRLSDAQQRACAVKAVEQTNADALADESVTRTQPALPDFPTGGLGLRWKRELPKTDTHCPTPEEQQASRHKESVKPPFKPTTSMRLMGVRLYYGDVDVLKTAKDSAVGFGQGLLGLAQDCPVREAMTGAETAVTCNVAAQRALRAQLRQTVEELSAAAYIKYNPSEDFSLTCRIPIAKGLEPKKCSLSYHTKF